MPRLAYLRIIKGDAVAALFNLYRQDPEFMAEWQDLRQPYDKIINKFACDTAAYCLANGIEPQKQYQGLIDFYSGKGPDPLPKKMHYVRELQPYFKALETLTFRWKLDTALRGFCATSKSP